LISDGWAHFGHWRNMEWLRFPCESDALDDLPPLL